MSGRAPHTYRESAESVVCGAQRRQASRGACRDGPTTAREVALPRRQAPVHLEDEHGPQCAASSSTARSVSPRRAWSSGPSLLLLPLLHRCRHLHLHLLHHYHLLARPASPSSLPPSHGRMPTRRLGRHETRRMVGVLLPLRRCDRLLTACFPLKLSLVLLASRATRKSLLRTTTDSNDEGQWTPGGTQAGTLTLPLMLPAPKALRRTSISKGLI